MAEGNFFFERDGSSHRYVPTPRARGPWDPRSLHGRVLSGLISHQVETEYRDAAFQPARLTVDMFRLAPMAPLTVTTRLVRDGNRIRVVDASLLDDEGTEIARGSVVMLRHTDQPAGEVWTPPEWDAPHPDTLEPDQPPADLPEHVQPMWETRRVNGHFGAVVQKQAWLRETHELIAGVAPSPFVRAAQASDFANPFGNSGSEGLQFVNADTTLYVHRDPVGEWIGMEVAAHHSSQGIAIAECVMYDLDGVFGRASVCGVANRRR
jgi:acyl-CoA thioesterase